MNRSDETPSSVRILKNLSTWLADRRGLPIVIGIIFVAGGGTLEFLNIFFDNSYIAMVEVLFRNFGLLLALIGIALLEPLGT
ncbi:MAG: hypothetical protein WBC91_10070 [Phototrophicaceae bacterium]